MLGRGGVVDIEGVICSARCCAGGDCAGAQGYTVMQLMQIVGDRNVRIVPDVAVSGATANPGLVDGLLGVMLRNQNTGPTQKN